MIANATISSERYKGNGVKGERIVDVRSAWTRSDVLTNNITVSAGPDQIVQRLNPSPAPAKQRVAAHSPEYLPRLAVMALAANADVLLLTDTFQYSRQSYHNRARIRKPDGAQWLTVPLEGGQFGTPINRVRIDASADWQGRHRRAVMHNYGRAPFFADYFPRLDQLWRERWELLGDLNYATVRLMVELLGIPVRLERASGSGDAFRDIGDLGPLIGPEAVLTGLDETVRAGEGRGVAVDRFEFEEPVYHQNFPGFHGGMTALDAVMNYGPRARDFLEARQ
jgi:hypothetical protein